MIILILLALSGFSVYVNRIATLKNVYIPSGVRKSRNK
jgi:hypothetical protein